MKRGQTEAKALPGQLEALGMLGRGDSVVSRGSTQTALGVTTCGACAESGVVC